MLMLLKGAFVSQEAAGRHLITTYQFKFSTQTKLGMLQGVA
jgi:hypothetical protein